MDESALRASIKTLESLIDAYGVWLNILACAVAVGVILETIFVVHAYIVEKREWERGIIRPPDRPSKKWLWFEIAGVLLVSVGVAGEFWIDVKVGDLGTKLRRRNADLVLILEGRVDGTAAVAAKARKDSETASKLAGAAKNSADAVKAKADKIVLTLALTQAHLATAAKQVSDTERNRKKLEEYLNNLAVCTAPRVIPEWYANGKSWVSPLALLRGFKANLIVANDPEAIQAAGNLMRVLQAAGVAVTPIPGLQNESIAPGVAVESFSGASNLDVFPPPASNSRRNAHILIDFLHSYNWQAHWLDGFSAHDDLTPDNFRVIVGRYPPPALITPPAMKELQSAMAQSLRDFRVTNREASLKSFMERTKGLSSQDLAVERVKWEAKQVERDELINNSENENSYPCRSTDAISQQP